MEKKRIDVCMVERNLAPSREKAQALVMAGRVYLKEVRVDKPSLLIMDEQEITLRAGQEYASRGGYKLQQAMDVFCISLKDQICLDIGAAAGGFTDVMLRGGARKVFAIDVGYGQMDWSLRADERVVVMERTNARYLKPEDIGTLAHFCSIDVSFISLRLILPAIFACMEDEGRVVCLVKPQFEAGRAQVGKKGVVRDAKVHVDVIVTIVAFCRAMGWEAQALSYSPIKGPQGNVEFLLDIRRAKYVKDPLTDDDVSSCVELAHEVLK